MIVKTGATYYLEDDGNRNYTCGNILSFIGEGPDNYIFGIYEFNSNCYHLFAGYCNELTEWWDTIIKVDADATLDELISKISSEINDRFSLLAVYSDYTALSKISEYYKF